mmetsp:Transcript_36269/g.86071  ORF Transcript_36269/g.86071 Transcript_36269/m.86071 type:complete len:190 (-) Transcript_36269:251-820(-)
MDYDVLCTMEEIQFEEARKFVAQNIDRLKDGSKLQLYGLYKQATEGACNISKPLLDFKGRAKWDAWNQVRHLSVADAMAKYVKVLSSAIPDWQEEAGSGAGGISGTAMSSLAHAGEGEAEPQTLHDWAAQGDARKVAEILETGQVDARDSEGCTALHFAADRGNRCGASCPFLSPIGQQILGWLKFQET